MIAEVPDERRDTFVIDVGVSVWTPSPATRVGGLAAKSA
jgi:hypothetical protein